MLARSSFLVLLGPQRLVFPSCYQIIILSPDHSTKKVLRSFSVPSPGPKHKLGCLPLRQGSLPKNKATSGNNFLRRICQRGLKIHSPSKTSLFRKNNRPQKLLQKFYQKQISASKNEKLQIVRNAFYQIFTPIRALFGR